MQSARKWLHPLLMRAERAEGSMAGELVDDLLRQIGTAHIGDRRRVDHIARRTTEQTRKESQARFPGPGAERGEPVGADVGGETALAGVARAGVVDGDEGRAGKSRPQHRFILGAEILTELGGHKPHHLALGDRHTQAGQKRHDPLAGHLALKMKHQHQTMEMGTRDRPRSPPGAAQSAARRPPSPAARANSASFRPSAPSPER